MNWYKPLIHLRKDGKGREDELELYLADAVAGENQRAEQPRLKQGACTGCAQRSLIQPVVHPTIAANRSQ
jgi:hypothetical protein